MAATKKTQTVAEAHTDRTIFPEPIDRGARILFFTLIVKTESFSAKSNSDIVSFLRDSGSPWSMSGGLCSTSAMSLDDLYDAAGKLEAIGLQATTAPVDFYLFEEDCLTFNQEPHPTAFTADDGELGFYCEDGKQYAYLKKYASERLPSPEVGE